MMTLAIRVESEGPLLILQDSQWGVAEACQFRDPFLKGLVQDAEHRLDKKHSAADP